jgi:N-acetylglucosaminyldiphosphoundecaprenol N-acetyl-beta-D-mannosaminyltransferase
MMKKVIIGNVLIDNLTMNESLDVIEQFIIERKPRYLNSANVDIIVRYNKDRQFAKFYDRGSLCLADGVPILWASRFLGTALKEKVSGSDLVPKLCELSSQKGYRIFFLGGRPGAGEKAKKLLERKHKSLKIIGNYAPPFGFEKNTEELGKIFKTIQAAQPDILLVGLGAPTRERWIQANYQQLNVPVTMGVGAAFELISGVVTRAPYWMQRLGVEWLWRLMMEPRRLWRRYLIDSMAFFPIILRQRFRNKRFSIVA